MESNNYNGLVGSYYLLNLHYIFLTALHVYNLFYFFSEMFYDRGNHHDFLSLVRQLSPPGELTQFTKFPFEFLNVDKPYETYTGTNVRLRLVSTH